jgi:release factor glutamine methyltransferase
VEKAVDLVVRLRAAGCVYADAEAEVVLEAAGTDDARLESLVLRRESGEPLEHVVGWADVRGHRIVLHPGVFVPRTRSDLLIDLVLPRVQVGSIVVDLCCGSGALAAALAAESDDATVYAVDSDLAAVTCARENLPPPQVLLGDLFGALPASLRGRVDVVIASAPYVPSAEVADLPREARDHEPRTALDGGNDGLDIYRRIASDAPAWLAMDGALIIETARHQADAAAAMLEGAGLRASIEMDDRRDATAVVGVAQPRLRRRAVVG